MASKALTARKKRETKMQVTVLAGVVVGSFLGWKLGASLAQSNPTWRVLTTAGGLLVGITAGTVLAHVLFGKR